MRLQNKVAIVTGAAQGIGRGYAVGLAREGAKVACADLNLAGAEETAAQIKAAGGQAVTVAVDIDSVESTETMARIVAETFGGIDILINNAALFAEMERHGLTTVPWDYLDRFLSINLLGALRCTRAVVPYMRTRGKGKIVNQSSAAAYMGAGPYGVAKAGINALTVALARELGPLNINVNCIAPGPTETSGMRATTPPQILEALLGDTPIKRIGTVEDMANAAIFLVSEESDWITGQTLLVDGGNIRRF